MSDPGIIIKRIYGHAESDIRYVPIQGGLMAQGRRSDYDLDGNLVYRSEWVVLSYLYWGERNTSAIRTTWWQRLIRLVGVLR